MTGAEVGVYLALTAASFLAAYIFAPTPPDIEGPRANDSGIPNISPGKPLIEGWGKFRPAGTVIHLSERYETKNKEKVGGKGGGSATSTTYTYAYDMVVAFCKGVHSIERIDASGKPLWTRILGEEVSPRYDDITFYTGTDDQLPDGLAEEINGVGNVSGYPGVVYVSIRNLQVQDFGNAVPNFTAYIGPGTTALPSHPVFLVQSGHDNDHTGPLNGVNAVLQGVDITGTNMETYFANDKQGYTALATIMSLMDDYRAAGLGSTPVTIIWGIGYDPITPVQDMNTWSEAAIEALSVVRQWSNLYTLECTPNDFTSTTVGTLLIPRIEGRRGPAPDHRHPDVLNMFQEVKDNYDGGAAYDAVYYLGLDWELTYTRWWDTLLPGEPADNIEFSAAVKAISDALQADGVEVRCIDMQDGDLSLFSHDDMLTGNGWAPDDISSAGRIDTLSSGPIEWSDTLAWWLITQYERDDTGGIWPGFDSWLNGNQTEFPDGYAAAQALSYSPFDATYGDSDATADFMWYSLYEYPGAPGPQPSTNVKRVIEDMAVSAGLTVGDHIIVDSALASMTLAGVLRPRIESVRATIEEMQNFHQFDVIETGDHIRCQPRQQDSQGTLRLDDFRADALGSMPMFDLERGRGDPFEISREIVLKFNDLNRQMELNSVAFRREFVKGVKERTVTTNITSTPAQAQRATEILAAYEATEIQGTKFQVPPMYIPLEPGDRWTIPLPEGHSRDVRLKTVSIGANFTLRIEAVMYIEALDTIEAIADNREFDLPTIYGSGITATYLIDAPFLLDTEPDIGGIYYCFGTNSPSWPGAALYFDANTGGVTEVFGGPSVDPAGADWVLIDSILTPVEAGTADDALANGLSYVRDMENSFTATFFSPDASFSPLATSWPRSRENVFLVGDEYLQALDVVDLGDSVWQFSNLLRGLRGTDQETGNHSIGERVVAIQSDAIQRLDLSDALIGATLSFRGVTLNTDIGEAATTQLAYEGVCLKPFAPDVGQVFRASDGAVTINILERARLGANGFDPGAEDVGVDTGSYFVIEYTDTLGGTAQLTRTLSAGDSDDVLTAAEQTTHYAGLKARGTLPVRIYQVSLVVGNGYMLEALI